MICANGTEYYGGIGAIHSVRYSIARYAMSVYVLLTYDGPDPTLYVTSCDETLTAVIYNIVTRHLSTIDLDHISFFATH